MRPPETFIGQPIRSLQTMLRIIAQRDSDYGNIIPDGIYGPQTMGAISTFQRKHGLPVTGITDQATWDAVVAEFEPALTDQVPAQSVYVPLNPSQTICKGESCPHLYLVQSMLCVISQRYGCMGQPPISGLLDECTADCISAFQHMCGLPMTGNLDRNTWKHLALQYPLATIKETP